MSVIVILYVYGDHRTTELTRALLLTMVKLVDNIGNRLLNNALVHGNMYHTVHCCYTYVPDL